MEGRALLIGFDEPEAQDLVKSLPCECIVHEMLPRIVVEQGQLIGGISGERSERAGGAGHLSRHL